jgi:hypothetical protein
MVMFRDSFGTWLIPYFSEHFSRSFTSGHMTSRERRQSRKENPDVVIFEMGERILESSQRERS